MATGSQEIRNDAGQQPNIGENPSGPQPDDPKPDKEWGCMHCMQEVLVDDFRNLKPGDQICLPGGIPIIGRCYRHHAIVKEFSKISDDGQTATVRVVDVDEKGKVKLLCCPCFRQPYPVRDHNLRDEQNHSLKPCCCNSKTCCCGHECTMCDDETLCCCLGPRLKLKMGDYRLRKFDKESTLKRASTWEGQFAELPKESCVENCAHCCEDCRKDCNVFRCLKNCCICVQIFCDCEPDEENCTFAQTDNEMSTIKYCFCFQNCEHFAKSCVNGPDDVTAHSLKESVSLQSLQFMNCIIWFIFWSLQVTFYGFNFWIYAVFAKEDPNYEFLSHDAPLKTWLNKTCTTHEKPPFKTTCDWKVLGIFLGIFFFISTLSIFFYYLPLFIKRFMCHECFVTVCINRFISRNIAFILVELVNIFIETYIYLIANWCKMNRAGTICLLIGVSLLGAGIFYTLVNMLDRIIVCCFSSYGACSFKKDYYRYVPFRYCLWLCFKTICNCRRCICNCLCKIYRKCKECPTDSRLENNTPIQ